MDFGYNRIYNKVERFHVGKDECRELADLALYLGHAVLGYIVGYFVREKKDKLEWRGKVSTIAIIVMVFSMGMRMGANDEVIENLSSIGLYSLLITVIIFIFSISATSLTRRAIGLDSLGYLKSQGKGQGKGQGTGREIVKEQNSRKSYVASDEKQMITEAEKDNAEEKEKKLDSMTIMVIMAVLIGGLIAYFLSQGTISDFEKFDNIMGLMITVGLCILLFFVGLDMGLEGTVISQIKTVGFRVLVIPVAVIGGSLLGAVVCGIILPLSMKEALAIGSGLGWYSLAPGIIIDHGFVVASAISFLHNIMREVLSFVLIPIVAKKIGYIETIALPGAAAMDVCLPIVERQTRSDIAIFSFVSGLVASFVVPVLVPLVLNI